MAPYTQKILDDGNVAVWLVDGKYVRDNLEEEFIGGGHYYRYLFIPENEIWIEDNTNVDELLEYLVHEVYERHLMKDAGLDYNAAHERASAVEQQVRDLKKT